MSNKIMVLPATIAGMRLPDPTQLNKNPKFAAELIGSIGMSQAWLAMKTGISKRRIQYLITGHRLDKSGETMPVTLSYPEQFILQVYSDMAEVMSENLRDAKRLPRTTQEIDVAASDRIACAAVKNH